MRIVSPEPASRQERQQAAAANVTGTPGELPSAFGDQGTRLGQRVVGVRLQLAKDRIDQRAVDAQTQQIVAKPDGTPSAITLDRRKIPSKRAVVEQAEMVQPHQRVANSLHRVAFPFQLHRQLTLGMRAPLERTQRRTEGTLFVGGATETLHCVAAQDAAGPQPQRLDHIARHRPRQVSIDHHARTPRPAWIGEQAVDDHSASSSSGAPAPAAARTPSDSRTLTSTSAISARLSLRKSLAFSRPWPMR